MKSSVHRSRSARTTLRLLGGGIVLTLGIIASGCASDDATPVAATPQDAAQSAPAPEASTPATSATPTPTQDPGDGDLASEAEASAAEDGGSSAGDRPASYDEAQGRIAALVASGATLAADPRFITSGDIYCVLTGKFVPPSCELGSGAVADPQVCANALSDAVGRIELGGKGAVPQCNTDTIREEGAAKVSTPSVVTAGAISCAVEESGVTCVDESRHSGFFLTPGDYATFG